MQTTFFGTRSDIQQVWRWMLEIPGVVLCETYSRPGHDVRWFRSWQELQAAEGDNQGLAAWSESFGPAPVAEKISFSESARRELGAAGRIALRSPAFIQMHINSPQNGCLAAASLTRWTEAGARQRAAIEPDVLELTDWKKLASVYGAVVRRLKKSSPGKLRAYPIMPDAWRLLTAGEIKLWNWGEGCGYPSDLILETPVDQ